jgi:LysM repeat protein
MHPKATKLTKHSPFIPQGSILERQRNATRIVISTVLTAHVILLSCLLIQGCKASRTTENPDPEQVGAPPPVFSADAQTTVLPQPVAASDSPISPALPAGQPGASEDMEPATPSTAPGTLSVGRGDSFYKIARANGVPVSALASANPGVDSRTLKAGQVLQLPKSAATPVSAIPATATSMASPDHVTYVVKSGDTLSSIAKIHETTVTALKAANGLKSDRIVVGRKLRMPESTASAASVPPVALMR